MWQHICYIHLQTKKAKFKKTQLNAPNFTLTKQTPFWCIDCQVDSKWQKKKESAHSSGPHFNQNLWHDTCSPERLQCMWWCDCGNANREGAAERDEPKFLFESMQGRALCKRGMGWRGPELLLLSVVIIDEGPSTWVLWSLKEEEMLDQFGMTGGKAEHWHRDEKRDHLAVGL